MYYDNGEKITKERIQDEDWYPIYQAVLEIITYSKPSSLEEFYHLSSTEAKSWKSFSYSDDRVLRWCVLHWERNRHFLNSVEEDLGR